MRTFTDLCFCSSHSIDCVIYQNFGPTVCMRVWVFYFLFLFIHLLLWLSTHTHSHSPTILYSYIFSCRFDFLPSFPCVQHVNGETRSLSECEWLCVCLHACLHLYVCRSNGMRCVCNIQMHVRFHCRSGPYCGRLFYFSMLHVLFPI